MNRWHAKTLVDRPTARSHAYSLLHAICASAVEAELLSKNPCAIKRAMSTNRKREPVLLSVAELKAVADAMRPEQFKALVLLSAWGALRFGEVTELRRKDFNDDYSGESLCLAVSPTTKAAISGCRKAARFARSYCLRISAPI